MFRLPHETGDTALISGHLSSLETAYLALDQLCFPEVVGCYVELGRPLVKSSKRRGESCR